MARQRRETTVASEPAVTVVTYYYIRSGHFISGLPTRDLTEAEWNSYPTDLTAAALLNDLYQRAEEMVSVSPVDDTPLDDTDEVNDEQPSQPAE